MKDIIEREKASGYQQEEHFFLKYLLMYHTLCFKIFYLFIYFIFGCAGSSLLHTGFQWLWQPVEPLSRCGAWASHCYGFSCCGTQALGMRASVAATLRL